jgi:hypothetical protein
MCIFTNLLLVRAATLLKVSGAHQISPAADGSHCASGQANGVRDLVNKVLGLCPWPYSLSQGLTCSADMLKRILQRFSSKTACLSPIEPAAQ